MGGALERKKGECFEAFVEVSRVLRDVFQAKAEYPRQHTTVDESDFPYVTTGVLVVSLHPGPLEFYPGLPPSVCRRSLYWRVGFSITGTFTPDLHPQLDRRSSSDAIPARSMRSGGERCRRLGDKKNPNKSVTSSPHYFY